MNKVSVYDVFSLLFFLDSTEKNAIDMAVKSLMDIVESGAKNIQVSVLTYEGYSVLSEDKVEEIVEKLENE